MKWTGALGLLLLVAFVALELGPTSVQANKCQDDVCIGSVKKVEHTWYVHDFLDKAKNQVWEILETVRVIKQQVGILVGECISAEECAVIGAETCGDSCPQCPACPSPCPNTCPPFDDFAVGLYGMAWDCKGQGLKLQFRPRGHDRRGWIAKCLKNPKVEFPVELDEIRTELKRLGYPGRTAGALESLPAP